MQDSKAQFSHLMFNVILTIYLIICIIYLSRKNFESCYKLILKSSDKTFLNRFNMHSFYDLTYLNFKVFKNVLT